MSAGRLMVCAVVCCKSYLTCKLKLTEENRRLIFKVQIFGRGQPPPPHCKKGKYQQKVAVYKSFWLSTFTFICMAKMWRKKVAVQNSNAQERQSYFSQNICRVYFSYPMPTVCIAWNKHVSCNAQKIQKNATHKRWTHIAEGTDQDTFLASQDAP